MKFYRIAVGCTSDQECGPTQACFNGKCVLPCTVRDPCGSNAICYNANHKAGCRCKDGFVGEPTRACDLPRTPQPVCQYNEDCPPNKFCDRLNRICRSPCMQDSCGPNAACYSENRLAVCKCFDGFTGNPYLGCTRRKFDNFCLKICCYA